MARVKETARETAVRILGRVDGGAYADIMLAEGLGALSTVDRALATELVMGVLRRLETLDWLIASASDVKLKKIERTVLSALRVGAYQLFFLDRVPPSAAVDETVKTVKRLGQGRAAFVNAVLRRLAAMNGVLPVPDPSMDEIKRLGIIHAHPEWIVGRWVERYGAEKAVRMMEANLAAPPKTIRLNPLGGPVEGTIKALTKEGAELTPCRYSPDGYNVACGEITADDPRYYIQDEASQLIARLVDPRPGERLLDACAAPGGKSTHMAALMSDTGLVVALDRSPARIARLKMAARRLKATIVKAVAADSSLPLPFRQDAPPFDAVLLDAPCSGLGVLRRTPDIKLSRKEGDIAPLADAQLRLLENVKGRVKRGGRLVYSVCTLEPEETTGVVRAFLDKNPDFTVEVAASVLPESCGPLVDADGFLSTDGGEGNELDGFFGARLVRR